MAFPVPQQYNEDPQFLHPFDPNGFEHPRFLFRVDNGIESGGPHAIILVQSQVRPDWEYAFQNARMFLAAPPETRKYRPSFPEGRVFQFRVLMNLTQKSPNYRKASDRLDSVGRQKDQGKRVPVTWEKDQDPEGVIRDWFAAKGTRCGFALRDMQLVRLGWVTGYRGKNNSSQTVEGSEKPMKFRSALLEGVLNVADDKALALAVASGIGSAKGFGFGLLSVAPV